MAAELTVKLIDGGVQSGGATARNTAGVSPPSTPSVAQMARDQRRAEEAPSVWQIARERMEADQRQRQITAARRQIDPEFNRRLQDEERRLQDEERRNSTATISQRLGVAAQVATAAGGVSLPDAATGAMQGFALGGPTGALIGAGVGLLSDFRKSVNRLSDMAEQLTSQLASYSPVLSIATSQLDVARTMQDIRRADRLGPALADTGRARFEMNRKWEDAVDKVLPTMLEVLTGIFNLIGKLAPSKEGGRTVENIDDWMANAIVTALQGAGISAESATALRRQLADIHREQLRAIDRDDDRLGIDQFVFDFLGARTDAFNEETRQMLLARTGSQRAPTFPGI